MATVCAVKLMPFKLHYTMCVCVYLLSLGCPFQGRSVINSVFGRLCRKTVSRRREDTGVWYRKRCGFIRFSLARTLTRIFFVPLLRSPRNKEGVANQEGYLRCSKGFDDSPESLYKFCHCSSLSQLIMFALGNS